MKKKSFIETSIITADNTPTEIFRIRSNIRIILYRIRVIFLITYRLGDYPTDYPLVNRLTLCSIKYGVSFVHAKLNTFTFTLRNR